MNAYREVGFLWLSIGVCSSAAAQSVGPQAMKNQLLDLRARELLKEYPGDKDAEIAVKSLTKALKGSDTLKTTVVWPCPTPPAPSPSGQVDPKVARMEVWEQVVAPEAERLAKEAPFEKLSGKQRSLLREEIAVKFGKPGDPSKFSTVVKPTCPKPSPSPSGAGGSKATSK